jgi:hypothetical protein
VRRLVLPLLLAAALSAGAASASGGDDAPAVAGRFLTALAQSDAATACGLFSPSALDRLGGTARCVRMLSGTDDSADLAAQATVERALAAARRSARRRRGLYVRKGFGLRPLARDVERLDPQLTVILGRGPRAAAGQLVTTAVLDTRSTGRRLVVYAESDDGSIWRLSAASSGRARIDEVAQGVPEAPPQSHAPAFTFTIDRISVETDASVFVIATLHPVDPEQDATSIALLLVPSDRGFLVEDLFTSAISGG